MNPKRILIFVLIIILLGLLAYFYPYLQSATTGKAITNSSDFQKQPAFVTQVVDGDTIHVKIHGNQETIRLLGINTPEHGQPYSEAAADFLKQEIEGKNIELLRDIEDTDKYNRELRYVFYNDNLINLEIIQGGYATTFMLDNLKYKSQLKTAEKYAINNNLRLWKKSNEQCADCIKLLQLNKTGEFFIIKNSCSFDCNLSGWFAKDDANHFFYFDELIHGQAKQYDSSSAFDSAGKAVKTDIWNNDGDRFFMRDKQGNLVLFYEY